MLLCTIYCLGTAPVSTRKKDTAIHSPPGMSPLPWSGIAFTWHSGSCCSQTPWGTTRSTISIWKSTPVDPRVRRIRRPRECATCAVFIPPHSPLTFPLATLQSTLLMSESGAQKFLPTACWLDCNRILDLAGANSTDNGHCVEVAWRCSYWIGTCQLLSHL